MIYQEDHLAKKAGDLAEKDVIVMDQYTIVADAAKTMRSKGMSSILVGRDNNNLPVGIVTERDILYRVIAGSLGPFKTTLKDIMSSPLVTISESATVRDAIFLMRKNNFRRMPVVENNGKIVGMLTIRSIIGNSTKNNIELPEVDLPSRKQVMCPYCDSKFENKQELSIHIDRLHLGSGLLEGDLRQW